MVDLTGVSLDILVVQTGLGIPEVALLRDLVAIVSVTLEVHAEAMVLPEVVPVSALMPMRVPCVVPSATAVLLDIPPVGFFSWSRLRHA